MLVYQRVGRVYHIPAMIPLKVEALNTALRSIDVSRVCSKTRHSTARMCEENVGLRNLYELILAGLFGIFFRN